MKRLGAIVSGMASLLCLAAGALTQRAVAQSGFPYTRASWSAEALDAEPKLHTKVWLMAPDSTIGHTLAELTARTMPLTHLKLQAQASVQPIPISCYLAGVPLRNVLNALTVFSTLQWKHAGETGLELGISYVTPWRRYRQPRTAYYGMRVIHELEKQSTKTRDLIKAGLVRLSTLPAPVQQAVQVLLKVRSEEGRRGNRPQFAWPVDPKSTGVSLDEETYGGETQYTMRLPGEQPDDDRNYNFVLTISFNASQAAEYQPDPRIDLESPDRAEAIRKDPRFAQPITLNLHGAPLTEVLKTLFTATHVPLLASGAEHPSRADIICKNLPFTDALDRICDAYGYRWDRLESGIVTLLPNSQ